MSQPPFLVVGRKLTCSGHVAAVPSSIVTPPSARRPGPGSPWLKLMAFDAVGGTHTTDAGAQVVEAGVHFPRGASGARARPDARERAFRVGLARNRGVARAGAAEAGLPRLAIARRTARRDDCRRDAVIRVGQVDDVRRD